jgi:hypothetical protein
MFSLESIDVVYVQYHSVSLGKVFKNVSLLFCKVSRWLIRVPLRKSSQGRFLLDAGTQLLR